MKRSLVSEKSYAFALRIISLAQFLRQNREYDIARQIMRSGTAIGANIEEGLAGVSRPDFISKMAIASKEARETYYWLRLIRDSKLISSETLAPLLDEGLELI